MPADAPAVAARRILLIAYHFPPSSAVGALRWEKLVGHFGRHGYAFDVVTLGKPEWGDPAARFSGVEVRTFPVPERAVLMDRMWKSVRAVKELMSGHSRPTAPVSRSDAGAVVSVNGEGSAGRPPVSQIQRARHFLLAHMHASTELSWARDAARHALSVASRGSHVAVITSGPPNYAHVAGTRVSRRLGLPHVADFRDAWALAESVPTDLLPSTFRALASRYERSVVSKASLIVMNTEAAAQAMRQRYPAAAARTLAVMNGSDAEDRRESPARRKFTVLYAGNLYLQRDPRVLFRACAPLIAEYALTPESFEIRLMGDVLDYRGRPTRESAAECGLSDFVTIEGRVPRPEALAAAAAASLLVCLPDGQEYSVPAKLFEYVQLDCWILAFASPTSALAIALKGVDADVVTADNVDEARNAIRNRFLAFREGVRPTRLNSDGRFDREQQANRFLEAIAAVRSR